jgi:hypothetical protein
VLLKRPSGEADFATRGFYLGEVGLRSRLERVSGAFLDGFNLALEKDDMAAVSRVLAGMDAELSGFAFEGAAMVFTLLDHLTFRKTHMAEFLEIAGPHVYMVHVGIGCAIARLPWLRRNAERAVAQLDPLMRWLAIDGYGFHQGWFYPDRFVHKGETDKRLSPAAQHVFDQGIGRSLWFSQCGDVGRIANAVRNFTPGRHADVWIGIGVACGMAGIVGPSAMGVLAEAAGDHRASLALGSINAVRARLRAGNPAPHTDLTCEVFCQMGAAEALGIADAALASMTGPPDYRARQQQVMGALRGALQRT